MPEIKDYTPAHLKCAVSMACPSINKLEDGRWLVVGARAQIADVPAGALPGFDMRKEEVVILPSDLLDEIKAEAIREYLVQQRAVQDEPLCDHLVSMPGIEIDHLGGNCPVQAEGRIDGKPFYFRARGMSWSLEIGDEPVADAEWGYVEDWGDEPYAAGWMEESEARRLIAKGAELFRNASPTASGDRTAPAPRTTSVEPNLTPGGSE